MLIYSNGCSHTVGGKTWGISYNRLLTTSLEDMMDHKTHLISEANHGKSNDAIFHNTLEFINKYPPDLCVIQWSSPNRRVSQLVDGKEIWINPWDFTQEGLKLEPMASKHTIHYIYALQEILKKREIPYLFMCYFPLDKEFIEELNTFDRIDLDRFIKFDDNSHELFTGFLDKFKENKMNSDEQGHPNQKGYRFITTKLLEKLGYSIEDISYVKMI